MYDWEEDEYCQNLGVPEWQSELEIIFDPENPKNEVEVAFTFLDLHFPEIELHIDERVRLRPYARKLDYLLSEKYLIEIQCHKTAL